MKKLILLMVVMMTALVSSAQNSFTISGKLEGLPDGTKINLVPGSEHKVKDPVASAVIQKGSFLLRHDIPEPRLFYLRVEGGREQTILVVAPGENITLAGTLNNPVISGSKLNNKFVEDYVKLREESSKAHNRMREKYSNVSKRMGEARAKKDNAAIAVVEASKEWLEYNRESVEQSKIFAKVIDKIASENKNTFWGPLLILTHTAYLTTDFEKYYNVFSDDVKKSYYGQRYADAQFGAMGTAPAFTAKDAQGNSKSLSDIMNGKNYVLIDFWASWCVPCRKFLPQLTELANKYADKGLVVVSISIDENKDLWLKALEEEKMPWLNLLDESQISKKYGVTSIPSVYLIDPNGKILFGKQSGDILVKKLEEVFESGSTVQAQEGTYQITGTIDGLGDQKVYISTTYKGEALADSVIAKNGTFTIKGEAPGALVYHLRFGKSNYLSLPIDANEKVEITGSLNQLNDAQITGAKLYPQWKEWFKGWGTITSRAGVLYKMGDSISKVGEGADRIYVDAEFKKLDQRLADSVDALVKKYPSSAVTPYIIIDRFVNYPNPEKAKSNYEALSQEGKNTIYGQELGESLRIADKTAIGKIPDFSMPDRDGKLFQLSSLRGTVVLVDFWASWCGPCRKENPNLVNAYSKYKDKGFEIVGISLDDKRDPWLKAIEVDKLPWIHLSDLTGWKNELAKEYGIKSIPTSFLLDAEGKIIAKDLRGDELEQFLNEIFK